MTCVSNYFTHVEAAVTSRETTNNVFEIEQKEKQICTNQVTVCFCNHIVTQINFTIAFLYKYIYTVQNKKINPYANLWI